MKGQRGHVHSGCECQLESESEWRLTCDKISSLSHMWRQDWRESSPNATAPRTQIVRYGNYRHECFLGQMRVELWSSPYCTFHPISGGGLAAARNLKVGILYLPAGSTSGSTGLLRQFDWPAPPSPRLETPHTASNSQRNSTLVRGTFFGQSEAVPVPPSTPQYTRP